MSIRNPMDLLFLQYYVMYVLVHVSMFQGKKLYFYFPYSYAYKLCLYSNTHLEPRISYILSMSDTPERYPPHRIPDIYLMI